MGNEDGMPNCVVSVDVRDILFSLKQRPCHFCRLYSSKCRTHTLGRNQNRLNEARFSQNAVRSTQKDVHCFGHLGLL